MASGAAGNGRVIIRRVVWDCGGLTAQQTSNAGHKRGEHQRNTEEDDPQPDKFVDVYGLYVLLSQARGVKHENCHPTSKIYPKNNNNRLTRGRCRVPMFVTAPDAVTS